MLLDPQSYNRPRVFSSHKRWFREKETQHASLSPFCHVTKDVIPRERNTTFFSLAFLSCHKRCDSERKKHNILPSRPAFRGSQVIFNSKFKIKLNILLHRYRLCVKWSSSILMKSPPFMPKSRNSLPNALCVCVCVCVCVWERERERWTGVWR